MFKLIGFLVGALGALFVAGAWVSEPGARQLADAVHDGLDALVDRIEEQKQPAAPGTAGPVVAVTALDTPESAFAPAAPAPVASQTAAPPGAAAADVPAVDEALVPAEAAGEWGEAEAHVERTPDDIEPAPVEPIEEDTESVFWQVFWGPFHNQISAAGFAERITAVTDLEVSAVQISPSRHLVAFAYRSEEERLAGLAHIRARTGLKPRGDEQ